MGKLSPGKFWLPLITIALLFTVKMAEAQQFKLTIDGHSNNTIIIPQKATVIEIQAAKVFQDYVQRISGAYIPIISDNGNPANDEIIIGHVNRPNINNALLDKLGEDGLFIQNTNRRLIIMGGTGKGVLYGVYTFLEKYLGCRKYSSKVTYVPKQKTIILNSIKDREVPAFTYREDFYRDAVDPEYQNWHKLDSHGEKGDNTSEWGSWVHTFGDLLSPEEYGESHPEYFSYYDGKRHPGSKPSWDGKNEQPEAQLCLSNPEVLEIVCKNLQSRMDKNPNALYWSVSQNDNVNYCRCPLCTEMDKKYAAFTPGSKMYGTHANHMYSPIGSGSVISFVNKVAERFPNKIISTLAYQYSRVPPKNLIPRKNVNIMLCNIESSRNTTIEKGDEAFSDDLKGWAKLTNNIIVWDYVIQFSNLISPFPNLRTLQPNLQFLNDQGVTAVFEQGNREIGGEFAALRAYLIAKLLWNPNINIDSVRDDFLSGYYGSASKEIKAYINLLHDNNMAEKDVKLSIFGSPVQEKQTFLSDSLIRSYNALFDQAEKSVAKSPEILQRVKVARLPIYYAMLEIAMDEKTGTRGAFIVDENNKLQPHPKIVKILYDFVYQCLRTDVSRVTEWRTTPLEYLAKYLKFLDDGIKI